MARDELLAVVRLYRELGFFAQLASLSDSELADHLQERFRALHHRDFDPSSGTDDLSLLALDEDRIWWQDLEDDVLMGNDAYVALFSEWARISRGSFQPEVVTERWRDEDGPVTITFRLDGRERRLRSEFVEWIDLGLLGGVNRLIAQSGYQFEPLATGGQDGAVVVLTPAEKARLEAERPGLFTEEEPGPSESAEEWVYEGPFVQPPAPPPQPGDAWLRLPESGAPAARCLPQIVWTGREVLIWGGRGPGSESLSDGAVYDPEADRWTPMPLDGAPGPRHGEAAVWTGHELLVWGGSDPRAKTLSDGARFDPEARLWRPLPTRGAPGRRFFPRAVWTGAELIIWGGMGPGKKPLGDGAWYDPAADRWHRMATKDAPSPRVDTAAIWTGEELLIWGGMNWSTNQFDGGRFDPRTNTWRPLPTEGAPRPRDWDYDIVWVWTGRELLVWQGCPRYGPPEPARGAAYDPTADAWRQLSTDGAPEPRALRHNAAYAGTGAELLVWDGPELGGAAYNLAADRWRPIARAGGPSRRNGAAVVWTGQELLVWGGVDAPLDGDPSRWPPPLTDGARYDPTTDTWSALAQSGAPRPRVAAAVVWTGRELFVWGGFRDRGYYGDGARLRL